LFVATWLWWFDLFVFMVEIWTQFRILATVVLFVIAYGRSKLVLNLIIFVVFEVTLITYMLLSLLNLPRLEFI